MNGVGRRVEFDFGFVDCVWIEQKSEQEVFDVGHANVILAHVQRKRVRSGFLADVQKRLVDHKPEENKELVISDCNGQGWGNEFVRKMQKYLNHKTEKIKEL